MNGWELSHVTDMYFIVSTLRSSDQVNLMLNGYSIHCIFTWDQVKVILSFISDKNTLSSLVMFDVDWCKCK